tara:strand:+ start:2095 stop:2256 length:162 start_codon:yes stop_codon:yes gene_type:complete
MNKKQIALYLIIGGAAVVLLTFISSIFSFVGNHPWLSLAFVSIGAGIFLLAFD